MLMPNSMAMCLSQNEVLIHDCSYAEPESSPFGKSWSSITAARTRSIPAIFEDLQHGRQFKPQLAAKTGRPSMRRNQSFAIPRDYEQFSEEASGLASPGFGREPHGEGNNNGEENSASTYNLEEDSEEKMTPLRSSVLLAYLATVSLPDEENPAGLHHKNCSAEDAVDEAQRTPSPTLSTCSSSGFGGGISGDHVHIKPLLPTLRYPQQPPEATHHMHRPIHLEEHPHPHLKNKLLARLVDTSGTPIPLPKSPYMSASHLENLSIASNTSTAATAAHFSNAHSHVGQQTHLRDAVPQREFTRSQSLNKLSSQSIPNVDDPFSNGRKLANTTAGQSHHPLTTTFQHHENHHTHHHNHNHHHHHNNPVSSLISYCFANDINRDLNAVAPSTY